MKEILILGASVVIGTIGLIALLEHFQPTCGPGEVLLSREFVCVSGHR